MQVGTQQQSEGGVAPSTGGGTTVARRDRRSGTAAIVGAVAFIAILVAALVASKEGSPVIRGSADSTSHVAGASNPEAVATDTAVAWVDGLATGLILPSDVRTRLAVRDPAMGEAVMAAWSRLDRSGDGSGLDRTVRWVDGLATGLIRPSDVTSRLAAQNPDMGEAVLAAWSLLSTDR
jgi:hypothetical protein